MGERAEGPSTTGVEVPAKSPPGEYVTNTTRRETDTLRQVIHLFFVSQTFPQAPPWYLRSESEMRSLWGEM